MSLITVTDYPAAGSATSGASAAALSGTSVIEQIVLQADPANTGNILIGNSATQVIVLTPGANITLPCKSLASVYHKRATVDSTLHYLGIAP